MKALSIQQPWAWAIIHAGKDVENRTWPTQFRGRVLIHAGKKLDCDGEELLVALGLQPDMWFGGVIGAVDIVDCVTEMDSPWFCGPYGFVLKNPEPLPFRPCRGRLGFFNLEDSR